MPSTLEAGQAGAASGFETAATVVAAYALTVRHAQERPWGEWAEQARRRLGAADRALVDVEARWWQAGSRASAAWEDVTAADALGEGRDLLSAVAVVADVAGQVSVVLGGAALVALAVAAAPAVGRRSPGLLLSPG